LGFFYAILYVCIYNAQSNVTYNRNIGVAGDPLMAVNYRRANELMLLIAASPSTPAHVLEQLSTEDDPQLLEHIAENPNTPSVTLAYLAGHKNSKVRIAVTHNPIAPSDIISALTNDENVDVRYAIACNPLMPIALIREICEDDNPYVAARARQTHDRMVMELGSGSAISETLQNIRYRRFNQQAS
jgi:hypothetical protein